MVSDRVGKNPFYWVIFLKIHHIKTIREKYSILNKNKGDSVEFYPIWGNGGFSSFWFTVIGKSGPSFMKPGDQFYEAKFKFLKQNIQEH